MLALGYVHHPLSDQFTRGCELTCWTFELLCSGRIRVQTPHGQEVYRAPSAMLIPPHTPYKVEWGGGHGRWTEIYSIFDPPPHWNMLLSWPIQATKLGLLDLSDSAIAAEVEAAFTGALEIYRSTRINRELLSFNALERTLLMLDEINPSRGHQPREARIEQALTFMAANYEQPLSLEVLARQVFLSPSRFSHLFKAQMGQAPMQYLEQYRLERAAEMLLSRHDSIEQIAGAVGFSNAFHFSTRFRRRFGRSPSHYRRNPK